MLVFALNCMLCRVDEWYAVIRHCFFSAFSHSTFVLGTWPTFPTTSSDNPTFFGGELLRQQTESTTTFLKLF